MKIHVTMTAKKVFQNSKKRTCPECSGAGIVHDSVQIGEMLRKTRIDSGISLRELARRMDLSAAYVSDLELGRRAWSKSKVEDYLRHLACHA